MRAAASPASPVLVATWFEGTRFATSVEHDASSGATRTHARARARRIARNLRQARLYSGTGRTRVGRRSASGVRGGRPLHDRSWAHPFFDMIQRVRHSTLPNQPRLTMSSLSTFGRTTGP